MQVALSSSGTAPTPRDVLVTDGTARLLRFRRPENDRAAASDGTTARPPVLLVPSMINRWYVVDLREGVSLAGALVEAGHDVYCLDWGIPEDEDRHLSWDDVLARLARMVRRVRRESGADAIGVLGYCMGGTLAAIHAALEPETVAAFVSLAAPIDFRQAGLLGELVDRRWFDVDAIADAGNVAPHQMQAGFVALRPTLQIGKWVTLADRGRDPEFRKAFAALETWAGDNIPFPASAYRTYIRELYQDNRLARGEHSARGRRVDLGDIRCPVLTVSAARDTICPPAAAEALLPLVGSDDTESLRVPGGHVGAVVGSKATTHLYPAIARWLAGVFDRRDECKSTS